MATETDRRGLRAGWRLAEAKAADNVDLDEAQLEPPGDLEQSVFVGRPVGRDFAQIAVQIHQLARAQQRASEEVVRLHGAGVGREHRLPVPVRPGQPRAPRGRARLVAERVEAEAGGQHQALLRARHGHVDVPFVVAIVDRGERRNGVDHVERRVSGGVDRLSHLRDP